MSDANQATGAASAAAIFDLDGVLTETNELHYQSWCVVADELGIPFDRQVNDLLRGVSRPESLEIMIRGHGLVLSDAEKRRLTAQKNEAYLELVARMTAADLLPGAGELLRELRAARVRLAVASSSRNAGRVAERLGIVPLLDALVDANTAPRSKPDPQVFLAAAQALGAPAARCVVFEDAEVGVAAARAGGMRVVGIGPPERVGAADVVVPAIADASVALFWRVLGREA